MNADDVAKQLEEIANAGDDFEYQSTQLTEGWKNDVNGAEAVEPNSMTRSRAFDYLYFQMRTTGVFEGPQ